ncbi:folate family ECF transporter S component, partial [bacterium]|nr:folate family ECF transporter S component [bacterium]
MKISSHKIATMGLLIALSIILTRIASLRIAIGGVEGIRIGLGGLPIILGGVLFGPLSGGLIGAISDVIGYFINPMGAYMPHFTLTSALTG